MRLTQEWDTGLEAILFRVIEPTVLPQDQDVVASMIEYYQNHIKAGTGETSQLDSHTRYHYSFSGIKCSVLGCFYKDNAGKVRFGADLENFYSAHNYSVIKPESDILKHIVNYRDTGIPDGPNDIKMGKVRYSSSQRFQPRESEVPVYVHAQDFAGKRKVLFGMTRTGKFNTNKKIIQACVEMSQRATLVLDKSSESPAETIKPFAENGSPKYPIGQIIFDINGEYANPNLQDEGTAIFDMYQDLTVRYSTVDKSGFKTMKVNFYTEIQEGFGLINTYPPIVERDYEYVSNFRNVSLTKPESYDPATSQGTRYDHRVAVYLCCLYRANSIPPDDFKVTFRASKDVCQVVNADIKSNSGYLTLILEQAAQW